MQIISLQSFNCVSHVAEGIIKMNLQDFLLVTPFKSHKTELITTVASNICQHCSSRLYHDQHQCNHHHHHQQHHQQQHQHHSQAGHWIKNLHFILFGKCNNQQ